MVVTRARRPIPDAERLIQELVQAMSHPSATTQPRVIWNPLPLSGKLDLIVIWERWKGLPFADRSDLILDACELHKVDLRDQVYTAIGRTTDEAIGLGYLPYRIAPVSHRIDPQDWDRIDKAMLEEGAVRTDSGLQLRFPSLDEAQDSFLRLQARVPGPYWSIVEETAPDD